MNAYAMAAQLLGDVELSVGQLAQLRAIDVKYQQRLFTLLHRDDAPPVEEMAELRAMIAADLLEMLTPEQRDELPGR